MISDRILINEAQRTIEAEYSNHAPADRLAAYRFLVMNGQLSVWHLRLVIQKALGFERTSLTSEEEMRLDMAIRLAIDCSPIAAPAWLVEGTLVLHTNVWIYGSSFRSGVVRRAETISGSYVKLSKIVAEVQENTIVREVDSNHCSFKSSAREWVKVNDVDLSPFDGTILPRSFCDLLRLAEEQRTAEKSP